MAQEGVQVQDNDPESFSSIKIAILIVEVVVTQVFTFVLTTRYIFFVDLLDIYKQTVIINI